MTRTTALLLVTVSLILPAAAAADVQQGTIQLSSTLRHHGDTLFVSARLNASGNVTSLTYVFQGNQSYQVVNVTDNLTHVNASSYRVQRFFDGSEAFDHYVLQYVALCDDDGCTIDSTNLTTPGGAVPSFDLVPTPVSQPDLVATGVFGPSNATEGDLVLLYGTYANLGNASASNFTVSLYLDSFLFASQSVGFLAPGQNGTISGYWNATAGFHTLTLIVDDGNAIAEGNELNNKLGTSFFVIPQPIRIDLGVSIRGVTHEPLRTEAGDLPHPYPRHTIHLAVTNDGDEASLAQVSLYVTAQTRIVPIGTSDDLATLWVVVPAHGVVTLDYVWEPLVAVGDVTIHAHVDSLDHPEWDDSNNDDSFEDFHIVGGLGGVVV